MKIYRIAEELNIVPSYIVAGFVEDLHHTYDDLTEGDILERVHKYEYYKLVDFPINDLELDEWDIDEDRVADFVEKIKLNPDYPPIVIDTEYGVPSIIDGIHRANAVNLLRHSTVKAYVPELNYEDL